MNKICTGNGEEEGVQEQGGGRELQRAWTAWQGPVMYEEGLVLAARQPCAAFGRHSYRLVSKLVVVVVVVVVHRCPLPHCSLGGESTTTHPSPPSDSARVVCVIDMYRIHRARADSPFPDPPCSPPKTRYSARSRTCATSGGVPLHRAGLAPSSSIPISQILHPRLPPRLPTGRLPPTTPAATPIEMTAPTLALAAPARTHSTSSGCPPACIQKLTLLNFVPFSRCMLGCLQMAMAHSPAQARSGHPR